VPGPDPTKPQAVFPFIVGCPRSGTTLLQAMLDSHPELAVPPESHFIPRLERAFGRGWSGLAREGRFVDTLFAGRRFQLWGFTREEVAEMLERCRPDDVGGAIRLLFATWAAREGKTAYADKTPRYLAHLERLARLFPEARFVHLIRDGRDVALSLAEAFERGPRTATQAALYWGTRVAEGRRQGQALPGRYLELRYERLVAEPDAALRELCEFIEVRFDPAMVNPGSRARSIASRYPDPDVHPNLGRPLELRRSWREQLSKPERRRFELFAGELLAELGYEVEEAWSGPEAERERQIALESEFGHLRHALFRSRRKAERRAERIRRMRRSCWSRLGAALSRPLG
jgi:hypothetical protein